MGRSKRWTEDLDLGLRDRSAASQLGDKPYRGAAELSQSQSRFETFRMRCALKQLPDLFQTCERHFTERRILPGSQCYGPTIVPLRVSAYDIHRPSHWSFAKRSFVGSRAPHFIFQRIY